MKKGPPGWFRLTKGDEKTTQLYRGLFHKPLFLNPYKPTRMTHGKYIISGFFFVAKIDFSKISVILESHFFYRKNNNIHQGGGPPPEKTHAVDDVDSEVMDSWFPKKTWRFSNLLWECKLQTSMKNWETNALGKHPSTQNGILMKTWHMPQKLAEVVFKLILVFAFCSQPACLGCFFQHVSIVLWERHHCPGNVVYIGTVTALRLLIKCLIACISNDRDMGTPK